MQKFWDRIRTTAGPLKMTEFVLVAAGAFMATAFIIHAVPDADILAMEHSLSVFFAPLTAAVEQILHAIVTILGFFLLIVLFVFAASALDGAPSSLSDVKTGAEFERYCARQLRDAGWDVEETRGSGDHGVDLLAKRNGLRVAIQCKFHEKAVGNKAVLEVVGGQRHYRAAATVVVSKSGYTPMAEELARSNGTVLLSHHDLPNMASRLDLRH
jgi:HJR/Mrr/RecB family endonuclease